MRKKILIACEFSQVITKRFREAGFEAYSCDILPTAGNPEWHIQDDVLNHLDEGWQLMIAHPPCTYLANSGVRWLYNADGTKNLERWNKMEYGALFFKKLLNAPIPHIAVENPIMHKYALNIIGKRYTQIIQPYEFGHPESKATCLWLKELPELKPTNNVKEQLKSLPKNIAQRLYYLPPSSERSKIRSITFEGIAQAIVEQWGNLLSNSTK